MSDTSDKEGTIYGPWWPIGQEVAVNVDVPTIVNGFGRPVETVLIPIYRQRERRAVWQFVGYEDRTVES